MGGECLCILAFRSDNVTSIPKEETCLHRGLTKSSTLQLRIKSLASNSESLVGKFEGAMMWDCCSDLRVFGQ